MVDLPHLKWKRPESAEFPKIWTTFKAKDIDRDELVEYRIQDLPYSKFDEALEFLAHTFCKDEPIAEACEIFNDPVAVAEFKQVWSLSFKQKMTLACFKGDSTEIIGMNANFIKSKEDTFMEELGKNAKSEATALYIKLLYVLRKDCDTFKQYETDELLGSMGLVVDRRYRGRGIAEQFLRSRKAICEEFGIKITSTVFTSDTSNKIADKVGFKLDKIVRYNDIRITHPHIEFPNIRSGAFTIKSIVF